MHIDFETTKMEISLESYINNTRTLENVSMEGFTNFLKNTANFTTTVVDRFFPKELNRAYKDGTKDSLKTIAETRSMSLTEINEFRIIVPEGFTGELLPFTKTLTESYSSLASGILPLVGTLKNYFAVHANKVLLDGMESPPDVALLKRMVRDMNTYKEVLKSNFKLKTTRSYSSLGDCVRSAKDIQEFYHSLQELNEAIIAHPIMSIVESSKDLDKHINIFIDSVSADQARFKANRGFKELTSLVYDVALIIEFIGYIQTMALQVYRTGKSISDSVLSSK